MSGNNLRAIDCVALSNDAAIDLLLLAIVVGLCLWFWSDFGR